MEQVDTPVGNHLSSTRLSENLFRRDLVVNDKECSRFCLEREVGPGKIRSSIDHVLRTFGTLYLGILLVSLSYEVV
jgi:hypothetical protein